jgi:mersacidin/lichenicidin family type 2 lantibiotic
MTNKQIIQFWKDDSYRLNLTAAERSLLPDHPAGLIELTNADLSGVGGGAVSGTYCTVDSVMATCNGCVSEYNCK